MSETLQNKTEYAVKEAIFVEEDKEVATDEMPNNVVRIKEQLDTQPLSTQNQNEKAEETENSIKEEKIKLNSKKPDANAELNAFIESLSKETGTSLQYIKFLKSLTEQDKTLPLNNVANIMKSVLPEGTKVSKEAKQLMQECCSELISFITSEATEIVSLNKRKTVMGDDIISSLYGLGFENYGEIVKIYLQKYREFQLLKQFAVSLIEEESSDGNNIKRQKKTPK